MKTTTEILNDIEYSVLLSDEGKTLVGKKNNFDYGQKVYLGKLTNGKHDTENNYIEQDIINEEIEK